MMNVPPLGDAAERPRADAARDLQQLTLRYADSAAD